MWVSKLTDESARRCIKQQIRVLCDRYQIQKLAGFGSILQAGKLSAEVDVGTLVDFKADTPILLFSLGNVQTELTDIFKRSIDLHTRAILNSEVHQ